MRRFLFAFTLAMVAPFLASAQGFPTETVRLEVSSGAVPAVHVEDLTVNTFFAVNATPGFAGFILPDPAVVGVRSFGAVKLDNTSNPVFFQFVGNPLNGSHLLGFNFLSITMQGDFIVIGCDGISYFVMSGYPIRQQFHEHRTIVVSAGQSPRYVNEESDRGAILRVVADTGVGTVVLPDNSNVVIPISYRQNFTVTIQRTANSVYDVEVCPPVGRTINGSGTCVVLNQPNEFLTIDYDSQEFFIVSRFRPLN